MVYLLSSVPLAMLRGRRVVWLIPVVAFLVVTVRGVALLATGAEGGQCDCGFGATALTGQPWSR